MDAVLAPSTVRGAVSAPPSKSMGHRALLCAALASGESRLCGLGASADIDATLRAVHALGAQASSDAEGCLVVRGVGKRLPMPSAAHGGSFAASASLPAGPAAAPPEIDCGESGSTLRFVLPLASLLGTPVALTGRGRLPERPQEIYKKLFFEKKCRFVQSEGKILIEGPLPSGLYEVDGNVSSQFISGLLFCLPLLAGDSEIRILPPFESRSYVQLTLCALKDFGVRACWSGENTLQVAGGQVYRPCRYAVEGDYSQAAFFAVLGAVCGGLTVRGLRPDSLQGDAVILSLLQQCGAHWARSGDAVRFEAASLHAIRIDLSDCPDLGPILIVLGLFCEGQTVIEHAGRLRLKESDRIAAMETELAKLGGQVSSEGGAIRIQGGRLRGSSELESHNDHRVAMALAVAALAAKVPVRIAHAEAVNKSYPGFWAELAALGAEVKTDETA